ncbi:hypothetical protein [Mycobacterium montefiorense]|uniref:hypothetical protein n=1 Tax=Mycobacterium montefiorense TaxID=154654 RepID=UPI0021DD71EB|nr:hypothetical protein [Mycobacterium montefiorense]MCV7425615.1 hypothetical protein [Mycobacterium montefiorense]GLE52352.1 hypothetical protein ATCCBAA256_19210 [Mycobacterium montefiorense]
MIASSDPEGFVTKFAKFWDDPAPQGLAELLHPDVVLVQPLVAGIARQFGVIEAKIS